MPHILFVSNSAYNLWHFRRPVWEALLAEGYQITALAPADGYEKHLQQAGLAWVDLPSLKPHQQNWRQDLRLLRAFHRIYRTLNPDLILHFTIKPNIYGSWAARRLGIVSVANVTGLGTTRLSGSWVWWRTTQLYRLAFQGLALVICQNSADQAALQQAGVRPLRWQRVPGSGVDTQDFTLEPLPTTPPFRFLFVGRILKDKGVRELFAAWRQVSAVWAEAELHLVGFRPHDHPHALSAEDWQEGLALPRVIYHGRVEDVRPILQQAQVVVLPSYREGLSRALLEAMATGRPIITTDVPGCQELVREQQTGWLVPALDSEALAEAMQQACSCSPAQLQEMGETARAMIEEQYSAQHIGAHYQELVKSLLCQ